MGARPQAILLPGAVLPADLAYGALLEALGDEVEARQMNSRSTRARSPWREYDRIITLPPEEMMPAFVRRNLRPGAEPPPPPPGPPPPWMAQRPAGLGAFTRAFRAGELDLDALRSLQAPVYLALGGLSNPDQYEKIAERLAGVFADFRLEVFEERHHFEPPHRVEPERLASSLRDLWADAQSVSVAG